VIISEIPRDELPRRLALLRTNLRRGAARGALALIARTAPDRARDFRAEAHRRAAIAVARRLGIATRESSPPRSFGWDGRALHARTEAYVLLHEIAHHLLAPASRRRRVEFGLGPGPETGHRAAAKRRAVLAGMALEREEAMASLLGILWEAELRQPALASFLDQNWLEGAERRTAAAHFETTFARLRRAGLVSPSGRPLLSARKQKRRLP